MKIIENALRALLPRRSGATPQRQLATRKAAAALFAALACIVLALALDDDERSSAPVPPRPWEAGATRTQLSPAVQPPLLERIAAVEAEAEAEAEAGRANAVATAPAEAPVATELLADLAAAPAAPVNGYRVQLGVFADPGNALALQQQLQTQGLPAGVQSRVVLGPFPDQHSARQAQARLRAAGMEEGMLLQPQAMTAAGNKAANKK